jgi:hypothetical protein
VPVAARGSNLAMNQSIDESIAELGKRFAKLVDANPSAYRLIKDKDPFATDEVLDLLLAIGRGQLPPRALADISAAIDSLVKSGDLILPS